MAKRLPEPLSDVDRRRVNLYLDALDQPCLTGRVEHTIAGATRQARDLRDSATTVSLGMSVLALGVAVVIGSVGSPAPLSLLLIAYLSIAALLGFAALLAMRRARTAEIARIIVARRMDIAKDVDAVLRSRRGRRRPR